MLEKEKAMVEIFEADIKFYEGMAKELSSPENSKLLFTSKEVVDVFIKNYILRLKSHKELVLWIKEHEL